MTAMKKTNAKTKSSAPAASVSKPTKKKAAPAAAKSSVATNGSAPVATATPAKITGPATAAFEVPSVKPIASARVQTKIVARADVGFGNALFVRGDGPGLSWQQGVPMECVANDQWEISLGESARPISFKVLLNDSTWCTGPDSTVISGSTATVSPDFA
jgi:hypothetical protein